ncbi:MAG: hypothetical protein H6837_12905 [Planctomycetes bacterium]|nr:hypothetical protein [Planctomycetota bacterium]
MSEHRFSQLALVIACFVTLGHALMLRAWMLDDAFIFFRYAENWVEGHGLRFNAGEAAVEGYSSFLWVALLAAGHLCNLDTVVWSLILGYACAAGTLVLVHQSWRWVQIDRRTASHACLLLGTCGRSLLGRRAAWRRRSMRSWSPPCCSATCMPRVPICGAAAGSASVCSPRWSA